MSISAEPERPYFLVSEVDEATAPLRIPHKFQLSLRAHQVFVHLVGVASEHTAPRWAVAVEIFKHRAVVLAVTRIDQTLYEQVPLAREAGIEWADRWLDRAIISHD